MPAIFRESGLRYHFYSFEGSPREPVDMHVAGPGRDAKLWVSPEVRVAYNRGFDDRALAAIERLVAERRHEIEDAWNAPFTGSDEG